MAQNRSESSSPRRRVLLGVTGGIAAYKTPELVRRLRERGSDVRVVLTRSAHEFVSALSLQAVSGHHVRDNLLDPEAEAGMGHIELARWADDIVIAPATAEILARLAHGHADDLLTTLVLASRARLWLAPAMNHVMWAHPAVQANYSLLLQRGARPLGPEDGDQACGETGPGRMSEPEAIAAAVLGDTGMPGGSDALAGKRFVVTAGPTFEALDPVRFIGNRSSGRMGFAVAEALAAAGAAVTLIAGPVHRPTPSGVTRIDVRSAEQMHAAVLDAMPADGFVGVAAVADYRPAEMHESKIKRNDQPLELKLVPNPDIVAAVAGLDPRPFTVGFAAETDHVADNARAKLARKRLDLIAANRVGSDCGFDCDDNEIVVHAADGEWPLGHGSKRELARRLVELIAQRMEQR